MTSGCRPHRLPGRTGSRPASTPGQPTPTDGRVQRCPGSRVLQARPRHHGPMDQYEHPTTKAQHRRGFARLLLAGTAALGLALAASGTAQAAPLTSNPACQVTYTVPAQFLNHFEALLTVKN